MKNKKQNLFERLFYNNKFLMIFSLLLAVVLWAIVKINYSESATRVITDVKVILDTSLAQENDFIPFYVAEDLNVDVEVSGSAYNINTYSLKRDDITIEAIAGYVDSAGYKTLNLSARANNADVEVVKITPSTVTVFFDRSGTETFNVEARLTNDSTTLASDGYLIGQPVPSVNTVDVTGPTTVLGKINKVYFDATLQKGQLPLTTTTQVGAEIAFDLEHERETSFLVCEKVGSAGNPATVTIPVYREETVETTVKFVNQPTYFDEHPPKVTITPATVQITFNADEADSYTSFNVGTIDFRKLENKVNELTLKADEKNATILSQNVDEFKVCVDLSAMTSKTFDVTASNVVFLNQSADYKYEALLEDMGLDRVQVIGLSESLAKLKSEDLQIEINVSALTKPTSKPYAVRINHISITRSDVTDCWVTGTYRALVQMSDKA